MKETKLEFSEGIVIAEANVKFLEVGKDFDDTLFRISRRFFGAGLATLGIGAIYNAMKEEQTAAVIKGIVGVVSGLIGLYLIFS